MFKKTEKQKEACRVLNKHDETLLVGGSRSAKTSTILRNIFLRALKKPSRHLVVRKSFNHVKTSIWYDSLPKVMAGFFPGLSYKENKTDWFITLPNDSTVWFGGIDDKDRIEKILGNEYSTIFANEVSQISYDAIIILRTRLAENTGLSLKFYHDCNPPSKSHWAYQEFIEKKIPGTREDSRVDTGYLFMNPKDNLENLNPKYIKILESFPKRQRDRFLDGLFLTDVEGALWTDKMISDAITKSYGDLKQIIICVDPAVTYNRNSDEIGIVVAGLDHDNVGVIIEDATIKSTTRVWAQRVVNLYNHYNANCVVVETNQGGDLVIDVLKNIEKSIKVVKVHASKGKFARAEPVSELYELGLVAHATEMLELQAQLTEYAPMNCAYSPGRLDAVVWALTYLMIKKAKTVNVA